MSLNNTPSAELLHISIFENEMLENPVSSMH